MRLDLISLYATVLSRHDLCTLPLQRRRIACHSRVLLLSPRTWNVRWGVGVGTERRICQDVTSGRVLKNATELNCSIYGLRVGTKAPWENIVFVSNFCGLRVTFLSSEPERGITAMPWGSPLSMSTIQDREGFDNNCSHGEQEFKINRCQECYFCYKKINK